MGAYNILPILLPFSSESYIRSFRFNLFEHSKTKEYTKKSQTYQLACRDLLFNISTPYMLQ